MKITRPWMHILLNYFYRVIGCVHCLTVCYVRASGGWQEASAAVLVMESLRKFLKGLRKNKQV